MPTATAPRRTHAERRAATQQALLDATLDVLVEHGFAGTTTTAICERAGLSQGALFRYHDTKADLFVAALEELFGRLYTAFEEGLAQAAVQDDRVEAAVNGLWEIFQRPDTLAALELYVAARTDPELREPLAALELRHSQRILDLAERTLTDLAGGQDFRAAARLITDAIQGASIRAVVGADPDLLARERSLLIELAKALLAPPSS